MTTRSPRGHRAVGVGHRYVASARQGDVIEAPGCSHLDQVRDVTSSAEGCEDCLAAGTEWLHLRMCLTCGRIGCCDQSPRRHARAHVRATKHPIVRSAEPGEDWVYCYPDRLYLEPAADG